MRRRMVYRPGFEGSPLRTAVSTSRMRDVPTLGPAPAAQANSFGLIRISDALSRLSILAIARLLDSVNFNSLGRQASTVAVLYGRLNKKAVPLPGERVDQQEKSRQHISGKLGSVHIFVQIRARVLLIARSWFLPRRLLPGRSI